MSVRFAVALGLAVVIAGCHGRRVYYPFHRESYRVGDRSEMDVTIDSSAQLDGRTFSEHRSSKRRNEIVAMQGERITAIRVELLEQTSVVNGVAEPPVVGSFVVEMHGEKIDVAKPDGTPPSEHDRAFVQAISAQTFRPPPAARERGYEIGNPVPLTSDEVMAFGLGSGASAELTLTTASDDDFIVQLTGLEKSNGSGEPSKKWSGQIQISRHGLRTEHWLVHVDLFNDHGVVGHSNQELWIRSGPEA